MATLERLTDFVEPVSHASCESREGRSIVFLLGTGGNGANPIASTQRLPAPGEAVKATHFPVDFTPDGSGLLAMSDRASEFRKDICTLLVSFLNARPHLSRDAGRQCVLSVTPLGGWTDRGWTIIGAHQPHWNSP